MMITKTHLWLFRKGLLIFLGCCGLTLSLNACTSSRSPSGTTQTHHTSRISTPTHDDVELQLLRTVERAETLGKGNPLILSSLYSLASYYRTQRQYEKAERQYQKALLLKEESSGPNHPDIAMILEHYATLLREANRHAEAKNLSLRAAKILAHSPRPSFRK